MVMEMTIAMMHGSNPKRRRCSKYHPDRLSAGRVQYGRNQVVTHNSNCFTLLTIHDILTPKHFPSHSILLLKHQLQPREKRLCVSILLQRLHKK